MRGPPRKDPKLRFWDKVKKGDGDACWLWAASAHKSGYGCFNLKGTNKAHRCAWELEKGPIPNGLWVLHKCDVRLCVRPDHLFLGTPTDNNRDTASKKRHRFGSNSTNHKLTEEKVLEIRSRYSKGGVTQTTLSKEYGVNQAQISAIVLRRQWRYV